jgi:amino acid transporter
MATEAPAAESAGQEGADLKRAIHWTGAFWIASGVPALLVFSVGYIASLTGPISVIIWPISVLIGFGMAFLYAEMAGMFPEKSGGPPVFGAQAWMRYVRPIAPLNIWGYWFAWSPVISIGGLLMGGYIVTEWIPSATWDHSWGPFHVTLAFVLGVAIVLAIVWINHFGIRESALIQFVLGVCSLVPLALLIVVPIFQGKVHLDNLTPFVVPGAHGWDVMKLVCAGLFVAAWSAYAFETSVVYTAEFERPQRDTPRAIFSSGGLCLFFYGLGPFILLSVVGAKDIQADPATALVPLSKAVFGTAGQLLIALLLVALLLSINTAILGSSRTLYQAAKDGWTFRFMKRTTARGVPLRAMVFDLVVNVLLMLLGNPVEILAASTIGYMVFNTLNLTAGYLLRKDAPGAARPYRAPLVMVRLGVLFAAVNCVLLFVGAPTWGWKSVGIGWVITLLGVVIYYAERYAERRGGWRTPPAAPAAGLRPEGASRV